MNISGRFSSFRGGKYSGRAVHFPRSWWEKLPTVESGLKFSFQRSKRKKIRILVERSESSTESVNKNIYGRKFRPNISSNLKFLTQFRLEYQFDIDSSSTDPLINTYDLLLTTTNMSSMTDIPCGLQSPFHHQIPSSSPVSSLMSETLESSEEEGKPHPSSPPLPAMVVTTLSNSIHLSTDTSMLKTTPSTSLGNLLYTASSPISPILQTHTTTSTIDNSFIHQSSDGNFVTEVISTGMQQPVSASMPKNPLRTILPKPYSILPSNTAVTMVSVLSLTNSASNSLSQISPVIKMDDKKLQNSCMPPNQIFTKIRPSTSVISCPTTQTVLTHPAVVSMGQRQFFPNQIPTCYQIQNIDSFLFQQNQMAAAAVGGGKESSVRNFLTLNSHNLPPLLTKATTSRLTCLSRQEPPCEVKGGVLETERVVSPPPLLASSSDLVASSNYDPTSLKAEQTTGGGNLEVASALLSMASENETSDIKGGDNGVGDNGVGGDIVGEGSEVDDSGEGNGEVETKDAESFQSIKNTDMDSFQRIIMESLASETISVQAVFTNKGTVKITDVEIDPTAHGIKKGGLHRISISSIIFLIPIKLFSPNPGNLKCHFGL